MKKINKTIIILTLLSLLIMPSRINAQEYKCWEVVSISDNQYDITMSIDSIDRDNPENICYSGTQLNYYIISLSVKKDGKGYGTFPKWVNPEYVIKDGEQYVDFVFNIVNKYGVSDGDVTCKVYIYGVKNPDTIEDSTDSTPKSSANNDSENINTTPSLTATSISLQSGVPYDINLMDIDSEEELNYEWTSSNGNIVSVDKDTGKVKGIKTGTATITCKIKHLDNVLYTLNSNITVNSSKANLPILTDSDVTLGVGDDYNIDIENGIAKSITRFISSDKETVSVNAKTGEIKALKAGKAMIICTVKKGKTVYVIKCNITVK
jgi:uncharacterized protein YjdB